MNEKLCIYICNSLVPEVSLLLQSGKFPDVTLKSFPATCIGNSMNNDRIIEMVNSDIDHFSKIIIFLSACKGNKNDIQNIHKKIEIVQLEQCFELFFNAPTIYHFIQQGNYLVTNGWLRNYEQHIREWGFDNQSARKFFSESIKKILLLDTDLPGDYLPNLEALSKYMGLPFDVLPIGNSHLQKYVEAIIFNWRNENERNALNERIANSNRENADNSLMFYHLQKLIEHTDELVIIQEILELSDLLFAPEQVVYQQTKSSETKLHFLKPNKTQVNFSSSNSFEVEINFSDEALGVLGINGIKFPEYIPKYKVMTDLICQMGALAISNARKYSELEKAKLAATESEVRFKTMFSGAPLGMALIDSYTGQIYEVNPTFAKIAGRSKEELFNIDWMQITHPDDVQEDLDNMALLNSGEINGFQMEKRYIRPNGTYVWIQMTIAPVKLEAHDRRTHLCMIEDIAERKQNEVKLHKLSAAVEQSPVSIIITDVNGNIEYANPVVSKLTGYNINELVGKNPRIFNSGNTPKEKYRELWKTINTGNRWQGEFYNKKKNGEYFWESAFITPIKNKKNKITHFLAVKEDITERKKAIKELHNSEARFKAVMKQSPAIVEMYDLDGIQRSVNHAYEELWGFPASHTVNKFNILKSEEVKRTGLIDYVMKAYAGESVKIPEYVFNPKGKTEADGIGRERWLSTSIYPLKDINNEVKNIIVSHEDISERKEAEIKIEASNQKFKNLSISATEMLNLNSVEEIYEYITNSLYKQYPKQVLLFVTVDEEKQYTTLASLKGISESLLNKVKKISGLDILGHNFKLVPSHYNLFKSGNFHLFKNGIEEFAGDEFPKFAAKAIEKIVGIRQIYTIGINKGNKLFATIHFFNRSKKPITDNEYIESFVKQAGIIIERKLAEDKLKQNEIELKETIATKDKFFSIISHDLRSPFASIVSLLSLLAENSSIYSPSEIDEFAKSAYKTAKSNYHLLENLLEWSRLQRGVLPFSPELVDLNEFVNTCDPSTFEMAKKKQIEIQFNFPEKLKIRADSNMLHSIMRNLVTNAIKFTHQGGIIKINAEHQLKQATLFSIKDSGIGMDKEHLNKLFDIGTNVSRPGTNNEASSGLGLILCKEFIEMHGGTIWVESKVDKGSTFYFTLPEKSTK